MKKIARIPGNFKLPEYDVSSDLEDALDEGIENVVVSNTTPDEVKTLKKLIKKKAVPADDMFRSYEILLSVEQHFENDEIEKHELSGQSLVYDEKKKCFKIPVPDLNEDNPFISGGDFVHLHDKVAQTERVLFITEVWNGKLSAEPSGPRKSIEWFSKDRKYDITFELSHFPLRSAKFAINRLNAWIWKEVILNPKSMISAHSQHQIYNWSNFKISTNKEQKKAIHDIVNKTAYPAPYILFGPPGTGKTATIVEAIVQIYQLDNTKKVLVCTPANTPADDITKMLIRYLPTNTILRLCSVSRETKLVDKEVEKCSNVYYETDENNSWRQTMRREEIESKAIIICTLTSSLKLSALGWGSSYFSHIFIDEAAQASEPETWIPISLLAKTSKTSTQIVLSGDPMQLGPVVKTKCIEHLLGVSMMERLMSLNCYENDALKKNYMTKLIQNYRCHSSIVKVPNELFYDDELQCNGGSETMQGLNWRHLPNKKFPVIFHAVFGEEKKDEKNPSPFNGKEIAVCLQYAKKLREADKFQEQNIGIITPFKRQEVFIKSRLKSLGSSNISVGTVQTFQGLEKDVIIMSTVRSKLLQHRGKKHIGFLSNKKRFNVSITRAKCLLIVIGNPSILQHDEAWYNFIKFCKENNACTGENFTLTKPQKFISQVPAKPVKDRPEIPKLQNPNSQLPILSPILRPLREPVRPANPVVKRPVVPVNVSQNPHSRFPTEQPVQKPYYAPPKYPVSPPSRGISVPLTHNQIRSVPQIPCDVRNYPSYTIPEHRIREVPETPRRLPPRIETTRTSTRTESRSSRSGFSKWFRSLFKCCSGQKTE